MAEKEVKEKPEEKKIVEMPKTGFNPYKIVKHPLSTEKSIRLMESENKLIFVVDKKAKRVDVKRAIEEIFKVKVVKVNCFTTPLGQKRAYVKFSPETPAIDIATNLGLM